MDWKPPEKPGELAESRLIAAILTGHFPVDSYLPAERELAQQIGVTRPTLREALQRLARDGWLEIHQGRATRVRNYWLEGNLAVLVAVALHTAELPGGFVSNLLEVRILLSPAYVRQAVERNPAAVEALLADIPRPDAPPEAFAIFDWQLHRQLTALSGNPVFTLFINSVQGLYEVAGAAYFSHAEARAHSLGFYRSLLDCARKVDGAAAGELAGRIMRESGSLWQRLFEATPKP